MIRKGFKKIILLVLAACMLLIPLASCKKDGVKIVSFTVLTSTVETTYAVGEEINFTSIKAEATYSDPELNAIYTYGQLSIEYPPDITATAGQKVVKVSLHDPHTQEVITRDVWITVKEA